MIRLHGALLNVDWTIIHHKRGSGGEGRANYHDIAGASSFVTSRDVLFAGDVGVKVLVSLI